MIYTDVIFLLTKCYKEDSIGNQEADPVEEKCFAKKNSVRTNEFYNALQSGLKPAYEFQVRKINYNGQSSIKYNDVVYGVIRTIEKSATDIVLVVEKKAGVNNG